MEYHQTEVKRVQAFLAGKGYTIETDGVFGNQTATVLRLWQKANKIEETGKIDTATKLTMRSENIVVTTSTPSTYPVCLIPSISAQQVKAKFGIFNYTKNANNTVNPDIRWVKENIVPMYLGAYFGQRAIEGLDAEKKIRVNAKIANNLANAFQDMLDLGIIGDIISCAGAYYPRMIRGSSKVLSNHSWGTAIDFNAPENWLGVNPAPYGKKGCLFDVVMVMQSWGFYWGGWYSGRKDGMHFESVWDEPLDNRLPEAVNHRLFQNWIFDLKNRRNIDYNKILN
jgi:hypothetical protein